MVFLRGWKYSVLVASLVSAVGLAIYPIVIDPWINTDKYKEIQERNRRGIKQADIQPGNMKVWTDPFDRKQSS